jgi:hypothetical protein
MGRRVHTVRYGRGRTTWTECLETEVVGIAGLTTYDCVVTPRVWTNLRRCELHGHGCGIML